MPRGRKAIVPHRRRRELKTDYRHRFGLLKSGLPRLVVRKSLNNMTCQIVEYHEKGDVCLVSAGTKELKKYGWLANTGNVPAAYLAGLLCGMKARKKKVGKAVLDKGLYRSTPGNRIYAALKGALDGGLDVAHSQEILPGEDRVKGSHVASFAAWLKKENSNEFKMRFSSYLKGKVMPESMPAHFDDVKGRIMKSA